MTTDDRKPRRPSSQNDEEFSGSGPDLSDSPLAPRKSAGRKMMDLLAKRSYSERELRQKLSRDYDQDDIDDAIHVAREKNWLLPDEELAREAAASLDRRNKGHSYIANYLEEKGLPPVPRDEASELDKAMTLVRTKLAPKLAKGETLSYEDRTTVLRLLGNRGFDVETANQVLRKFNLPESDD